MNIVHPVFPCYVPSDQRDRRVPICGDNFKNRLRLLGLRRKHNRAVRLDNFRLFLRNGFVRVPQDCRVLQADLGDDTHERINNVGRIQAPPESDLDNRKAYPFVGKIGKRKRRIYFKERDISDSVYPRNRLYLGREPIHAIGERGRRDKIRVDAAAFARGHQMGRSKQARLESGMAKYRRDECSRGSFSLAAGDMDHLEIAVRIPKSI